MYELGTRMQVIRREREESIVKVKGLGRGLENRRKRKGEKRPHKMS